MIPLWAKLLSRVTLKGVPWERLLWTMERLFLPLPRTARPRWHYKQVSARAITMTGGGRISISEQNCCKLIQISKLDTWPSKKHRHVPLRSLEVGSQLLGVEKRFPSSSESRDIFLTFLVRGVGGSQTVTKDSLLHCHQCLELQNRRKVGKGH